MNSKLKELINKVPIYLVLFSIVVTFAVVIISIFIRIFSPDHYNVVDISKGWTDDRGNSFSLDEFNSYDGQQMLAQRIYKSIKINSPDVSVIFRCRNCYCNMYINGVLVHEDVENVSTIYGSSPGSRWHTVSVNSSPDPVELCLEVTACFYDSNGLVDNMYIGPTQNVYRKITSGRIVGFIISTFLHLLSIIIILLYIYLKKYYNVRQDMLYLGIATFFSAQWSISESLLWQLFVGYSEIFHLIGYLSLAAIPLAFGVLAISRLKGKVHILCWIYSIVSAVNFAVITILHVLGIMEFHYSLTFTHVLLVVLIPLMVLIVLTYTENSDTESDDGQDKDNILIFTLLFVIIACLITALVKYHIGSYGDYSSYIRICILCFLFCLIIYQMNQIATTFSKGLKADMMHNMALTDHMTGLYNRTAFSEHMPDYNHIIDSFSPLGVVQFDVNNLKTVNDTLGHEKGDQMIKSVAEGLKLSFNENCKTYRTGGDEFLTMIQSLDPYDIYNEGIIRLQKYCDEQNAREDLGFKLYIAHGFVLVKGNKLLSEAIDEADALMYENKREIKLREKNPN